MPNRSFQLFIKFWAPGLVALGLALIGWAFVENSLTQVQPVAAVGPTAAPIQTQKPVASATPTTAPLYTRRPVVGEKIGIITLPSLKLSWPIYEGTSDKVLAKGVGHYQKSVLPGMADNSVLSGHRSTVFNRIGELKPGNEIFVKTGAGLFTYEVVSHRIVRRTDRTVIVPTSSAVLTLTTCWPFNQVGLTYRAYVVTAKLVSPQR